MNRIKKAIAATAASLLRFVPLTLFLYTAFRNGSSNAEDWLSAFLVGATAAVLQVLAWRLFARRKPMNRVALGVNLYLIMGGAAVQADHAAALQRLDSLKESGLFLSIFLVGIFATLFTRSGFVGHQSMHGEPGIQAYSFSLLALAALATAASFAFRGNLLISAIIPLIVLSIFNRVFQRRIGRMAKTLQTAATPGRYVNDAIK